MENIVSNSDSTEFNYLQGYYLKISYSKNTIMISAYNLEKMDGRRFESQLTITSLSKLNRVFQEMTKIRDIYNYMVRLIKDNNFKIGMEKDTLVLTLIIQEQFMKSDAKIVLCNYDRKYGNSKNNQEYINILTNEIMRLKKTKNDTDELMEENKELKNEINKLKSAKSEKKEPAPKKVGLVVKKKKEKELIQIGCLRILKIIQ